MLRSCGKMQDEAFHEIQLNGKQLVFLFMAATVVSVVIFLCGVMVGRGVQTPRGDQLAAASQTSLDPTTSFVPPPPATAAEGTDRDLAGNADVPGTARGCDSAG
jgi:hypothetical protein